MYGLLAEGDESRERRNQRRQPVYTKPELVATAPNEVWSWDIMKLLGPRKWTYYYLYVLLDLYSRYAVGWRVAGRENATLASNLIEETCRKHEVSPKILTLHSDRGAPMTAKCTAQLLAVLGVTRSLSRPRVSDDNPFSEAQFKTLKYHPGFPGRFESQDVATNYCREFFAWYNPHHRHGGIAMPTPIDVYFGRAQDLPADRQKVLTHAYRAHPERFPRGRPPPAALPEAVFINPLRIEAAQPGGAHSIENRGVSNSLAGTDCRRYAKPRRAAERLPIQAQP
jgi:putative transposase